jgi:hypothetical protein
MPIYSDGDIRLRSAVFMGVSLGPLLVMPQAEEGEVMKNRTRFVELIVLAVLAIWAVHYMSGRVRAIPPGPTESLAFGAVGLVDGQTARLNVSMLSPAPPSDPTAVEIRFLDGNGGAIKQAIVQLAPGQTAFVDFSLADVAPGAAGGRVQIRAEVRVTVTPGPNETPSGRLISTLEVFDNATGKTSFLYSPDPCITGECRRGGD